MDVSTIMKTLLITLLLSFSCYANAGIYKWTDENGNVHYGDRPTTTSEKLNVREGKTIGSSASSDSLDDIEETREERRQRITDSMTEERLDREKKKSEKKKKKAEKRKKCNQAKDTLKRYNRANTLYTLDKKGERQYMSNTSRDQKISSLKKQIRKHCR